MPEPTRHPVLLFDGVCNLCTGVVQFVIRRDPAGRFRFAALQSEAGQAILSRFDLPRADFDTFVLLGADRIYTRSTAALRVARGLSGAWPLLYALSVIPRPVRDLVYGVVARHRYRWFGRKDRCMVPTADVAERFL
jgi:predicted DCC family thiol-disulfide oxidoreductase YuxK